MNYSDLRDIQKREMESSAIVPLAEDFYKTISKLLSAKKEDVFTSKSLLSIKEYENIKKIVLSIQAKREEKIVLMSVRGDQTGNGLTAEEKELLKDLSIILNKARDTVRSVWTLEESASDAAKIKLLQDVSQYKGLDNVVYGPFKAGNEETLPRSEADWLLKSKLAELI
ncbi:DNA replication complex GINS family protein [Candidatus Micrarchaeota archaeon]|nr:DNA replication complex GINS family protein [Candidatus Micrarchaeota archaeon]